MREIVVFKSKRVLEVRKDGIAIQTYPIGIGKSETGHKEVEGDMRTPIGDYVVCVKNPKSKFHLSLGLNYPNNRDAEAGLKKGLITKEMCDQICAANNAGKTPPWKTPLGGEIFIHGNLEKKTWSEGCVRMFDPDIEILFAETPIGTKVTIYP